MNHRSSRSSLPRSFRHRVLQRASVVPALIVGIVGQAGSVQADTSSTLTGLGATNENVPVNHGSNAEVTLTWQDTWDQYTGWDGRGDVYQVDQPIVTLMFAPTSPNIKVSLQQLDLDEWAGGGDTSARWTVVGSTSGLLASGTWDSFNTLNDPNDVGGRSLVAIGANAAAGESLTLIIDHTNTGTGSYLAMDNLAFSTMVVPEPATGGLLSVAGLGALAMRRRRASRGA